MRPVTNELTTIVLGAPNDWDEKKNGPCNGLPVCKTDEPSFYSYWGVDWPDRLKILFGRPIRLCVCGTGHPPVNLDTVKR
jgi:hypothetical protein